MKHLLEWAHIQVIIDAIIESILSKIEVIKTPNIEGLEK
jgi:hypothetical protein